MSRRARLSFQIVVSMGLVSVITMLIAFVIGLIFYGLYYTFWPQFTEPAVPENPYIPDPADYLFLLISVLFGLVVAVIVALRLAKRILVPLNSLAENARRIATGDLTARSVPGDRSLGETALLVDDFNAMAERLEGMTSEMTAWNAAIAHELRTPLTILRGRLQGLRDGVFAPSEALFAGLLDQVEGLSRLVDDLHIVTLNDVGRLELHLEPTRIDVTVQQAVLSVENALRDAGFNIQVVTVPLHLYCDAARIRQTLLALLDNARRYAVPGAVRVELSAHGRGFLLVVEDEGPGLNADFARHVFEPFSREDASRSRRLGGSGLGLSVVRAIARAHGGEARYRASSLGGSAFELEIPATLPGPVV
ncbi:ATP-binding protein [Paraburkholderia sabiae]|uniref:histidine kinase n=1 Tax=Paraburkholderia sabiae TaxID=273251 RepID=A0ABU9QLU5_9BURK|nr:ATP-binding protein [Paraburkholderia sabiae]WJZ77293.1 ATP-binding protein [Paraburkholderia sabiae]CAD6548100.1 Adaptive-response sensory-kinase SasA [Paraburkholderia sabiae]